MGSTGSPYPMPACIGARARSLSDYTVQLQNTQDIALWSFGRPQPVRRLGPIERESHQYYRGLCAINQSLGNRIRCSLPTRLARLCQQLGIDFVGG